MKRTTYGIFAGILITASSVVGCIVRHEQFDNGCAGHLYRASIASSTEVAAAELDTALEWAEAHDLTHGTTAIFYPSPGQDIGFWYQNLRGARDNLRQVSKSASPLERSNVLLKLRESLGAMPSEICDYPHTLAIIVWNFSGLLLALGCLIAGIADDIREESQEVRDIKKKIAAKKAAKKEGATS